MEKQPCPKCGSYNVVHLGVVIMAIGIACAMFGLIIWPLLLLATPFIVGGFLMLIVARGPFAKKSRLCRECNFQF